MWFAFADPKADICYMVMLTILLLLMDKITTLVKDMMISS